MPFTPNLNIEHLDPNSDQPEVPVNEALDALDAKITDGVTIGIGTSTPVNVSQTDQAKGSIFTLAATSPGPSGAFTVQFAAFGMGLFSVYNATGQTATLKIAGQPLTAPTLAAGQRGIFQSDGVNVVMLEVATTSGVYTPALTNVLNLDSTTAFQCQYMRVGNVVTVSGKITADPTAAGDTKVGISLPIASTFANAENCGGTAFSPGIAGQGAAIEADTANHRAQMEWIAVDVTAQAMFFSFTYEIL